MNPEQFLKDSEDTFYHFNPPWTPYENQNILKRAFRLKEEYDTIFTSLETLAEIEESLDDSEAEYEQIHLEGKRAVFELMEGLEIFLYNFPELLNQEWFASFWQTVAGATWRAQEGRFKQNRESLRTHVRDILDHSPDSIYTGIRDDFHQFIEWYGREISPHDVPEEYENDVYEARDLFCLGYYSTALLVLGRAVERALLELGQERKIETLRAFGQETGWDDARFYSRKEALTHVQEPTSTEKMISERQYHEISVLVDYRNNVAHAEYRDLDKGEALRQINNAFSLLAEICEKIEELRGIDDDEIEPVYDQTVN